MRIRFEKSGTATIYVLGVRSIKNGKWRVANSGRALVEPDGWTLVPELVETIVLPPPPERSVSARS